MIFLPQSLLASSDLLSQKVLRGSLREHWTLWTYPTSPGVQGNVQSLPLGCSGP